MIIKIIFIVLTIKTTSIISLSEILIVMNQDNIHINNITYVIVHSGRWTNRQIIDNSAG